jgi:hypothetical protein
MTVSRDVYRMIHDYLEDGPNQLADRSYDAVRSQIDNTRQRVVIGPWRLPDMSNYARYAIAGVIVLALAFVGINLLPKQQVGVGTPGASPTATPMASPQALTTDERPLAAGTYTAGQPFVVPMTFTVPDGWTGKIDGPYALFLRSGETEISFARAAVFYVNPCHPNGGLADADSGAARNYLAGIVSAAPGFEALYRGHVDNHAGYYGDGWGNELTITAPASSADCPMAANGYPIWQVQPYGYEVGYAQPGSTLHPGVDVTPSLPMGATKELLAGRTDHISSFQVENEHFLIDYTLADESDAAQQAEVNAILDSVQINAAP